MFIKNIRILKSQFILFLALGLIIILSLPGNESCQRLMGCGPLKYLMYPYSELNILEISQAALILMSIYEIIKFRSIFKKVFSKLSINLKLVFLIFLFYEEISFISQGRFNFTSSYNASNQLNIHNSSIGRNLIFENFQIPFTDYFFSLSLYVFLLVVTTLTIGFGNYFKIFKNIRILFLSKRFSFFYLIYPLNIILTSILHYFKLTKFEIFLDNELVEFFLYFVLLIDTSFKRYKIQHTEVKQNAHKKNNYISQ